MGDTGSTPTTTHDVDTRRIATGRPLSACMRCKSRKIKCNYDHPVCQACSKANSECHYPNLRTSDTEQIRSLESRLRSMEQLLSNRPPTSTSAHPPAASPHLESPAFHFRVGPPSSWQALDRLPSATELLGVHLDPTDVTSEVNPNSKLDSGNFPDKAILTRAADYFFDKINPMYPILQEPSVRSSIGGMSQDPVSAQWPFTSHLLVALYNLNSSTADRVYSSTCNSRSQARAAWNRALSFSSMMWNGPVLGRLQAILLMLQYVLRDPDMGDVWDLSGRASRMAIDLGLHLEPPAHGYTPGVAELRRMLFWTTFNCDCMISVALGRPPTLHIDWISTRKPTVFDAASPASLGRKSAALINTEYRLLQTEIHQRLFAVSSSSKPPPNRDWFTTTQTRLDLWRDSYSPTDNEYMNHDRLQLHYNMLQTLLYRPSPGHAFPPQEALCIAVRAAANIMRIYKTLLRKGELHFFWLGVHHVFMAGVTYLNSLWIANRQKWRIVDSYVDAILDIQTCSQVLEGLTAREPGTQKMRDAFEIVSAGVVRHLSTQTNQGWHGFPNNDPQPQAPLSLLDTSNTADGLDPSIIDAWIQPPEDLYEVDNGQTAATYPSESVEQFLANPFVGLDNDFWEDSLQALFNQTSDT